jgi:hypothetical protein
MATLIEVKKFNVDETPDHLAPSVWAVNAIARERDDVLRRLERPPGPLPGDVASNALRGWVASAASELERSVQNLDLTALASLAARYDVLTSVQRALLHGVAMWPAGSNPPGLVAGDGVALRFLIEVAVAHFDGGRTRLTDEQFHRAWALASEIVLCGALGDAVRAGFGPVNLTSRAGRLGLESSERLSAAMSQQRDATFREWDPDGPIDTPPDELMRALEAAYRSDYGFGIRDVALVLDLVSRTARDKGRAVSLRRHDVVAALEAEGMSATAADGAIDFLSLTPQGEYDPAPERFPWRFQREHSYLSRPLLSIKVDGSEWLLCSPEAVTTATNGLAERIFHGRLPSKAGSSSKAAVEKLIDWNGRSFERAVASVFAGDERFVVLTRVEKPLGRVIEWAPGRKLGDMDVIVIQPATGVITLIEAKGAVAGLVPGKVGREVEEWQKIWDAQCRRLRWLHENRQAFAQRHTGVVDRARSWRVLGRIVVRDPVASAELFGVPGGVSTLTELRSADKAAWLDDGVEAGALA